MYASGHPKHFHKNNTVCFSDFFFNVQDYDGGTPKYGRAMFSENFINLIMNKWHKLKTSKFKSLKNNWIKAVSHTSLF